jgi:putative ABC transport system permease protein
MIGGNSSDLVAMVGKSLATKNNLSVGSTFTAYTKTFTVKAIFSSGNTFEDSGVIMPLATLQTATDQAGAVTSVTATADSADNVDTIVASLKTSLADKADVTAQSEQAAAITAPLENIANLATGGVVAASAAGAVILLLSMIMIVRERKREIGVIKAIGGTNTKVIVQFMTEALTLTFIGAIVGIAMGIFASGPLTQSLVSNQMATSQSTTAGPPSGGQVRRSFGGGFANSALQTTRTVTSSVTPGVFAASIGIVVLVALLGSAIPAWLIARVKPAEVLRSE